MAEAPFTQPPGPEVDTALGSHDQTHLQPSMANLSECGTDVEVGGAKSGGAGGLGGLTAGLFRRRKKNHDEEEETAIVFAFDEGTNIKKSDVRKEQTRSLWPAKQPLTSSSRVRVRFWTAWSILSLLPMTTSARTWC